MARAVLDRKKTKKKGKKKAAKKAAKKKAKKVTPKNGAGRLLKADEPKRVQISEPKLRVAAFDIVGTTPYVQSKFSQKALQIMRETQELGSVAKKGRKKDPKDFNALFLGAIHFARPEDGGWAGIPANGIRAACVSACRTVGFKMTLAKLSIFIEADGFDATEGTPLVKITPEVTLADLKDKKKRKKVKHGPRHVEHAVRIQNTTDIRVRAMWSPGWRSQIRVQYDADQFLLEDVANLLMRVGLQVGLGEGRPDSRSSAGMGWGLFAVDR